MRVDSLTSENSTLKSEIERLSQDSEKLKTENSILQVSWNTIHRLIGLNI
jgi:FtsZ-binding cell division protein ZapB